MSNQEKITQLIEDVKKIETEEALKKYSATRTGQKDVVTKILQKLKEVTGDEN